MPDQGLRSVTHAIPGSTSNIGPGFDCMGIALDLYNQVTISWADSETLESPSHPLVAASAQSFFEAAKLPPRSFEWNIQGEVPISRGLGSSVTLRYGVLAGLNVLSDQPLSIEKLFAICTELEGHPDNASASIFGGFAVTSASGQLFTFPIDPSLKFLLLIPEEEQLTEAARSVLPETLNHKEATKNIGNASAICAAFASNDYEKLAGCFTDYFHQPFRAAGNPGLFEVIEAGQQAGALGGFLSGSGSTIACCTLAQNAGKVTEAMREAYSPFGEGRIRLTTADNEGAQNLRSS